MNRNIITGIVVVVILGVGAYFLFGNKTTSTQNTQENITSDTPINVDTKPTGATEESTDSSDTKQVKEFTVTGSSFKFDPSEIKVKKGDTVKITFKNAGGFHDFNIEGYGVKTKQGSGPSEETVTFVADKAGEFAFYCSVGQHRANGMEGKLVVE